MNSINRANIEEKYSSSPVPECDPRTPARYSLRSTNPPPLPSKNETDVRLLRSASASTRITRTLSKNDSSFQHQSIVDNAYLKRWNKSAPRSQRPESVPLDSTPPSTPFPPPSPIPRIIAEEKKGVEEIIDSHVSSSVSLSLSLPSPFASVHMADHHHIDEGESSPRFYPLPSFWKYIPSRARIPFINNLRPLLSEYSSAHTLGDRRRCDQLLDQLLNIPRIFLPVRSHRGQRRIDSAEHLRQRLQHRNYRDEIIIPNNRPAEKEKRVIDQDANAVKRAVSLVKMGDNRRAIQTLSSHTPIAPINEATLEKLRELHPPQSGALPPSPPPLVPILVNPAQLSRIIRHKMNNGASGGPSGWTGKHLQPLATNTECMQGLAAIIQDICNGDIVDLTLRNKLLACRLIPLSKGNGGIRPVAIGEVFCKLASCYLISLSMNPDSYRLLFPTIQEGVGIAGGCEKVIHFVRAARRAMGDDSIVITVDFKNAYNMRKRIDMWNCLLKHSGGNNGSGVNLSPLIRYFHWAYSVPSPLVLPSMTDDRRSNRLITMQSCEGVRQGANESSLLFSLSMQEIYEQSLVGLDVKSVQAKAIQDDFTIVGKPAEAFEVFQRLMRLSAQHGMQVQPNKCKILPPSVSPLSESSSRVIDELKTLGVSETSLLLLLGAAIGQDEDIDRMSDLSRQWAERVSFADNEHFFRLLTHRDMPVQIAFRLLVSSGLPRLAYLCRVMPPSSLSFAILRFDTLIMDTLYKLFDIDVKKNSLSFADLDLITRQAQLKMKNGGLGITPCSNSAPAAFISSLAIATPDILSLFAEIGHHDDAVKLTKEKYERLYQQIRQQLRPIGDDATIVDLLPPSKEFFDNEYTSRIHRTRPRVTHPSPALYVTSESATRLQSKLTATIEEKRAEEYQSSPSISLNKNNQARLLSASQPSASIWLSTLPEEDSLRLSNNEFRAAINHRLALSSQRFPKCCECDPSAGPINDSQHAHVCKFLRKEETFLRHQLIRDTLSDLCRFAGFTTSHTHHLIRLNNEAEIQPDLYVFTSNKTYMIDVSITYPAADSFVDKFHTDTRSLAAAVEREKQKVRKYDSLARRNGMTFVPFVLESFGAIGKEAKELISIIAEQTEESNQFYAYALRRLSITLQKGNAFMQAKGMPRLFINARYINTDRRRQVPDLPLPLPLRRSSDSLSVVPIRESQLSSVDVDRHRSPSPPSPVLVPADAAQIVIAEQAEEKEEKNMINSVDFNREMVLIEEKRAERGFVEMSNRIIFNDGIDIDFELDDNENNDIDNDNENNNDNENINAAHVQEGKNESIDEVAVESNNNINNNVADDTINTNNNCMTIFEQIRRCGPPICAIVVRNRR